MRFSLNSVPESKKMRFLKESYNLTEKFFYERG